MLWVRLPPGPLENNTPSWSSLECSPPCQGGGRRFKSDRGCLHGAVRQLGRATDFKRPWMWVRIPPVLLEQQHVSAGHWRAQVAVTHPLSSFGGSTPSRRTYNTARSSNGRMRDPHSRDMGSIPIRVTDIAKWRNRDTRDAQNVVSTWTCEFDSRLGYFIADAAGAQPALIRPVSPVRSRDLLFKKDEFRRTNE